MNMYSIIQDSIKSLCKKNKYHRSINTNVIQIKKICDYFFFVIFIIEYLLFNISRSEKNFYIVTDNFSR
jgi:hypothetical protein